MAREWQPASSFSLIPNDADESAGAGLALAHSVSRNWAATRGAVLWEGAVDLAGSFPGFASWGSRAQSVHLTLTDRFVLVDEGTDYGFGLPIGWLSAAQALTGVEPIAMESGDHLRVCYLDGNRVRGFSLRVRGGRFGSRSGRRANQLRAAAMSLGLASATPSTDLLLPPEHDLSLDWDAFASFESEPVIWTGRAVMPIGSGLESAVCDVWLTSASLIWGASSRAGIYRIATGSLDRITKTETPAYEPVIYWTVGGSHQTSVDLPMIFAQPNRNDPGPATRESLVELLEAHGHRIDVPASPPQPWRTAAEIVQVLEPTIPPADAEIPVLGNRRSQGADGTGAGRAIRPVEAGRRRLMDDGLFPERVQPTLPRSTPRPWGERVERVGDDAPAQRTTEESTGPSESEQPPTAPEPVVDRLRIWPPAVPRQQNRPSGRDATAMLVRRPRVRATTTEEFLASEQAARAATVDAAMIGSTPHSEAPTVRPTLPDRGVIVRFRRPQTAVAQLSKAVHRAEATVAARSTSSFASVSAPEPDRVASKPATEAADQPDSRNLLPVDRANESTADIGESVSETAIPAPPPHLVTMRSALSAIDVQLALAIRSITSNPDPTDQPAIAATAPFLAEALAELDAAVTGGELAPQAAETHRHAMSRSADTTERLRSLLDLHARGYLSAADLESRRVALLGRMTATD